MLTLRQLTEIEKAALTYKYYNGVKSFEPAFILSHPEKKLKPDSLKSSVSHWKNSPEVQNYLTELAARDKIRLQNYINSTRTNDNDKQPGTEANAETTGPETNGGTFSGSWINFRDINEFLKYCEAQANRITEEKDKQQYLKMIAELMRFKEQDKTTGDLQRFYVPLQCSKCPLYNKLHE